MSKILDTIRFVVENSKHVKINKEKIHEFCKRFKLKKGNFWLENKIYDFKKLNDKDKLHFLLVYNSINFSFWGNPKWSTEYKNKVYSGSFGVLAALAKSIDKNIPILSSEFLEKLEKRNLENILFGNVEIPLFNKRLGILKEIGKKLNEKFKGDFRNLINKSGKDAVKLLELIIINFPSFNDVSVYENKEVLFHKRAQLLVYDINSMFEGTNHYNLSNISKLTASADYKIPQVLRKLGILQYTPKLSKKIDNKIQLQKDSKEEVEIRANMVWAVELMKQILRKKIPDINSSEIDYVLWLKGKETQDNKPHHLIRTIYY